MNTELKKKLIASISSAKDLADLKASLLDLLGVAVADDWLTENENDAEASGAEKCSDGRSNKRPRTDAIVHKAKASEPKSKAARRRGPMGNVSKASASTVKPSSVEPGAEKITKPEALAVKPSTAEPMVEADDGGSQANLDSGLLSSDVGNDGAFQTVVNRKNERKNTAAAAAAHPVNGPRTAKPKPLVLEGVKDEAKANPLTIRKLLESHGDSISKTVSTKSGTILVFAHSGDEREALLKATLGNGLTLRPTKERTISANAGTFAVITGIHPSLEDKDITDEVGRPCKRILSAKLGGAPTWKVKVTCESAADRKKLTEIGVGIGFQRYKVAEFKHQRSVLQCYRCQTFGHVASACSNEEKCRNCGESHNSKDCTTDTPVCANCSGPHAASDHVCPALDKEKTKREVATLNYANAVKKGGDQVDCLRLACSVAKAMSSVLIKRLGLSVNPSDICKDVADHIAMFYKVDIGGAHVYDLAYTAKKN
jgi:hypothetical protein